MTKCPSILTHLLSVYKSANDEGAAYRTLKACVFTNNQPVNIVSAMTAIRDIQCMIRLDRCHAVELEYCIRYFSEVTAYSAIEINQRL